MSLTSAFTQRVLANYQQSVDLATGTIPLDLTRTVTLASGTAAGQADQVFIDTRSIAPSANEDLDLNGSTLRDGFGNTLAFLRVKALYIAASAANANNVIVGAAAATQWATLLNATGTITLRPGASFMAVAGAADAITYAVVAGASDFLRVANSGAGTPVTYDIVIVGATV